jgi:hypothetical protein
LQLYSRWAKPYLVAAQQLESSQIGGARNPALVKTFNTILLELTLLGKQELKISDEVASGKLPVDFAKMKFNRKYYSLIFVDFKFRGIPQKVAQQAHYAFGGRAEVTFSSYSLNKDELDRFEEELKKSEVSDVLTLIEGATGESLKILQEEINFFLEEKSKDEEKKENQDTSNPVLALFGIYNKKEKSSDKKPEEKKKGPIKPETWIEKTYFRTLSAEKGKETVFSLFDIYKKSHKMESFT